MKTSTCTTGASESLFEWLEQPSAGYSLVIGATCGCAITRLGRAVSSYLNQMDMATWGHYKEFGPDDIRQLAGVPSLRQAILEVAARKGIIVEPGCDYECMVRSIASLGGAVLCGEWAFESCMDMDHVFRVSLSHCERCVPASCLKLDPQGYSSEGLAKIIAKRFKHWIEDQSNGRKRRVLCSSVLPLLL